MKAVTTALSDLGDFGALLKSARLADGSQLKAHPAFAEAILSIAEKRGSRAAPAASGLTRFEELNLLMTTDIDKYNSRTGRRTPQGDWETYADEHLALRRKLEALKRA
jgi:hypothetical protein